MTMTMSPKAYAKTNQQVAALAEAGLPVGNIGLNDVIDLYDG
jgi:hypothetical protein